MTTNNDRGDLPALSDAEKLSIAERFAAASRTNDAEAYRALCAPDAVTWHNFDDAEVTTEQTLRTVAWLHRTVPDLTWTDVAFHLTPTGWVSQTFMTGTAPGGPLRVHSCVIVTLGEGGLVTRVEEYLDPTQTAVLRG
jgi:ketosteroid isomerase-like protein